MSPPRTPSPSPDTACDRSRESLSDFAIEISSSSASGCFEFASDETACSRTRESGSFAITFFSRSSPRGRCPRYDTARRRMLSG